MARHSPAEVHVFPFRRQRSVGAGLTTRSSEQRLAVEPFPSSSLALPASVAELEFVRRYSRHLLMRLFSPKPILWWAVFSGLLGFALSFVPWGSSAGFHGTGFPVFVVAWDRSPTTGQFTDFPNILGYVLNPFLVFVAGFLLWFVCWLVCAFLHRTRTA